MRLRDEYLLVHMVIVAALGFRITYGLFVDIEHVGRLMREIHTLSLTVLVTGKSHICYTRAQFLRLTQPNLGIKSAALMI